MDNVLISRSSIHEINNLKEKLSMELEMKNLCVAKQVLEMRITRDSKTHMLKSS